MLAVRQLPRPGVPRYQVQRRAHVLVGRPACARSQMGGAGARPLPPALAPAQRRPVHPPLGRPRLRARNRAPHGGAGYGRLRGRLGGRRSRRGPHPHRGRQSAPGLAIQVREALVPLHALGTRGLLRRRAGCHLARAFPAALRSGGRRRLRGHAPVRQDRAADHLLPLELHERRLVSGGLDRELEHLVRTASGELPPRRHVPRHSHVHLQQHHRRGDGEHPGIRGGVEEDRPAGGGGSPGAVRHARARA